MFSKGSKDEPMNTQHANHAQPNGAASGFVSGQAAAQRPQTHMQPQAATSVSVISADLKVVGNLICQGAVQIDGQVEGDIDTKQLTIGEQARISGTVKAETIRVAGTVEGELSANTVVLLKTARVTGDIVHKDLAIETGAYLEGNVRRSENPGSSHLGGFGARSQSASSAGSQTGSAERPLYGATTSQTGS
jgi:cytoskeletal protein CcmA (bactofilin family)